MEPGPGMAAAVKSSTVESATSALRRRGCSGRNGPGQQQRNCGEALHEGHSTPVLNRRSGRRFCFIRRPGKRDQGKFGNRFAL